MAALKRALLVGMLALQMGCMALLIADGQTDIPISLSGQLSGYKIHATPHSFREEVWIYHFWNIQHLALGTLQDGLRYDHLLHDVVRKHITAGQGVIHLKIRHERNTLTLLSALFTLGIMTPTAVIIEGDIVDLESLNPSQP